MAIIATGILATVIAYLTLTSKNLDLGLNTDKLYHFIAFAALVFPCALLFARTLNWLLPAALLFGRAIELIQPYVGRGGELADFVADVLGVFIGAALGLTLRAIVTRRATTSASSVWWIRIFQ
jgi:VanZ family protein